ncbi:MAG: hypothetical protein KRP56_03005 [Candidatus Methanogranum gryphiswaldense]|nr:MAG: hypothetical protein KRP56_03005 [Candidatus Methanogranum sp. U3.2.1]
MENIEEKKQQIKKGRSQSFSKVYATNVLVSETDSDVRLYGFNEILNIDDTEKVAISDGELILTFSATILLYEQLKKIVEKWNETDKKVEISEVRRATLENLLKDF